VGRLNKVSGYEESAALNLVAIENHEQTPSPRSSWPVRKHAWKADFNQCTGRQMVRALRRALAEYGEATADLPFVLIGHSKLFTPFNEWSLRPFLSFVSANPRRFGLAKFPSFDLENLGSGCE
jgi:hypothetical protein